MNFKGIIGHGNQLKRLELMRAKDMVPHTMLFSGPAGTGKRIIAERFIASMFCESPDPPCLECRVCRQLAGGTYPDFISIVPDEKGAISIDTVRWLIDRLSRKPVSGRYGVTIDSVEKISIQGQNALLKTIEEPPAGTHIVLVTSNKSLILPTILSRSSEISFYPLDTEEIRTVLSQQGHDDFIRSNVPEISGGSLEIAHILADSDNFNSIMELCRDISSFLDSGTPLTLELKHFNKGVGMERLILILTGIYRYIFLTRMQGGDPAQGFMEIAPDNIEKVRKLIKILLALWRGFSNNLNVRSALKGMLYAMDEMDEFSIPGLQNIVQEYRHGSFSCQAAE